MKLISTLAPPGSSMFAVSALLQGRPQTDIEIDIDLDIDAYVDVIDVDVDIDVAIDIDFLISNELACNTKLFFCVCSSMTCWQHSSQHQAVNSYEFGPYLH